MIEGTLQVANKICQKCKQLKQLEEFAQNLNAKDNRSNTCKECRKIYYQQNKSVLLKRKREYYKRTSNLISYKLKTLLHSAKHRASRDSLPFDLTLEWLQSMVISHCPITLEPLDWEGRQVLNGTFSPNSPSIDKIKPELGYIQSNCAIVSHRGNTIKNNGTIDEHLRTAQYMAAQQLRDIEF
jgi:hypothetical protein